MSLPAWALGLKQAWRKHTNCQDKDGSMIFRYDNAKHKPDLGFDSHKHVKEKVLISEEPELRNILEEIMVTF